MDYSEDMTTTPDTTKLSPVEIDTQLARLWRIEQSIVARINTRWSETKYELKGLFDNLNTVREEAAPYEDEYSGRGGWNRYFLVTNANGHVHRGMNCNTCFPTTQYSWIIDLADCDEAKMIEEYGERACTVCFPDAPAHPAFRTPGRRAQAEIDARAAEKAARAAVKDAKAITDVDGSPLRGEYGVLATKVAARNALSEAFSSLANYGDDHPSDFVSQIRKLVPALEAAGVDWRKSATNAVAKAAKAVKAPNQWANWLTPEQVADAAVEAKKNLAQAQALLAEIIA